MLPLLAAVPAVMMGAVGLVGGAAALAGGVMAAGSTMAGIAADAAGGVIGAASRLTGGGKSAPQPEAEAREPADQSTSDEQGAKALPPGVKLNKNGVMIQDSGGPGGGRILPGQFDEEGQLKSMDERLDSVTADRSGASPVNQILDYVKVIAANTARTAMGIGALMQQSAAETAQDNAETAQDNIAGAKNEPPEAKQGMVSKVFGGLTSRMRKLSDGLGGVAKFMLKGLGLAGLIYLFKKNEESITKAVAGVFKFFHNLYKDFKDSDDPMGDLMKKLKEKFDEIAKKVGDMFMQLVDSVKLYVNEKTGIDFFKISGDTMIAEKLDTKTKDDSTVNAMTRKYSPEAIAAAGDVMGFERLIQEKFPDMPLAEAEGNRMDIYDAVESMLITMIKISKSSDGRVQWTGVPRDLSGADTNQPLSTEGIQIPTIINSKPVIDGVAYKSWDVLDKNSDSYFGGLSANLKKLLPPGAGKFTQNALIDLLKQKSMMANSIDLRETLFEGGKTSATIGVNDYVVNTGGAESLMQRGAYQTLLGSSSSIADDKLVMEKLDADINHYKKSAKFYDDAGKEGSIFTHDTHLQKLLEPVSKAFADGAGSGTVIMDNSSNTNSVTKQGDNIQMPLDVHHSDPTSRAFHQWYHA